MKMSVIPMEKSGVHVVKVFGHLRPDAEEVHTEDVLYWGVSHEKALAHLEQARKQPGMIKITYEWIPNIKKMPIWSL